MNVTLADGEVVTLIGRVADEYVQGTCVRMGPTLIVGICSKRICFWKKQDPLLEVYHWGGDLNVSVHDEVLRLGICLPVKSETLRNQLIASLEILLAELRMGAESSMLTISSDYSGIYERPAA